MTFRYQAFTAPGTWTNPGTVTRVEVTVVGGGGGATNAAPGFSQKVGGGGGGVRKEWWDVSGPVPVTVGAGGSGGPGAGATQGGRSSFGPLGPGPIPLIPTDTLAVGGGEGGGQPMPTPELPIGGGATYNVTTYYQGGRYGTPGYNYGVGGKGYAFHGKDGGTAYWGEDYYGNAGTNVPNTTQLVMTYGSPANPTPATPYSAPATACANTGSGGSVIDLPAPTGGGAFDGASGIVIVRWFE